MGTRLNCHDQCFEQKLEKYHNFSSVNYHFYSWKNSSILHGRVIVMLCFVHIYVAHLSIKQVFSPQAEEEIMCVFDDY